MKIKNIPLFNRTAILLAIAALLLNLIFLYFHNPHYYYTISQAHGQIGYNFYHYNTCKLNPALTAECAALMKQHNRLINFDELYHTEFGAPADPFPINDTIGYGIVLGLLWKLTNSLHFKDVQILQIIIFSLLMLLFYQIAYLLFGSKQTALYCGIAQLFFFPLFAMNVQPTRDIWAYYAMILFAYGVLNYLFGSKKFWHLLVCALLFALCQFVRPSVVLGLMTISVVLLGYALFNRVARKPVLTIIAIVLLTNIIFFWIPFITFNYKTYNRCFVGPVGQDLLEGLGEFPNPWGFQLSDHWIDEYIYNNYGLHCGTPAFDDLAKQEFWHAFWQKPSFYFYSFFKRIPPLLLPGLPWIYHTTSPYEGLHGLQEKITFITNSWHNVADFLLRHVYIRLFLLLSYCGAIIALMRKQYFAVAFILLGIVCAGLGKLPSHIEYRYIVPFYWGFALLVGYLVNETINYLLTELS